MRSVIAIFILSGLMTVVSASDRKSCFYKGEISHIENIAYLNQSAYKNVITGEDNYQRLATIVPYAGPSDGPIIVIRDRPTGHCGGETVKILLDSKDYAVGDLLDLTKFNGTSRTGFVTSRLSTKD